MFVCVFASWKRCILWCGIHFNTIMYIDHSSKVGFGEVSLNNWGDVPHLGVKSTSLKVTKMKFSVAPSVHARSSHAAGQQESLVRFRWLAERSQGEPCFSAWWIGSTIRSTMFIYVPLRNTWTSGTQEMNLCMVSAAFHSRIGNTRSFKRSRCHKLQVTARTRRRNSRRDFAENLGRWGWLNAYFATGDEHPWYQAIRVDVHQGPKGFGCL